MDERFGADIVVTRNVCTNESGELVLEAFTTMMGQQAGETVAIGAVSASAKLAKMTKAACVPPY